MNVVVTRVPLPLFGERMRFIQLSELKRLPLI